MARTERWHERVSDLPTAEELRERARQGWKIAAIEWQREAPAAAEGGEIRREETPYGLLTPAGDTELTPSPREEEELRLILRMVIDDRNTLATVAAELNRRGFRTRHGRSWSQRAVFDMLPRLVEVAPRFFGRPDWPGHDGSVAAVTH